MHAPARYTVPSLASLFKIRQQRVMAILALKGMEHGDIPMHTGKQKPNVQATSTAKPATQVETDSSDSGATQDSAPESEQKLDARSQAVKAAMEEAAIEVPRYLDNITKESETWHLQSLVGTPQEQAADSNILTAWIKSMVKDPFWVRPSKDEKDEPLPDMADLEEIQDDEPMSKADQELDQQFLQKYYQERQRGKMPASASEDSNTPEDEGYERYLLSNPDNLHHIMEHDVWDCQEAQGTGERHVKFIPRYPKFDVSFRSLAVSSSFACTWLDLEWTAIMLLLGKFGNCCSLHSLHLTYLVRAWASLSDYCMSFSKGHQLFQQSVTCPESHQGWR